MGHVFAALTVWDAVQAAGGRFILRIEDIDRTRCTPAFEQAIYDDLSWLGLSWEQPVRRQSDHMGDYQRALERLRADGLLYRCFHTRREIAEAMASAPHGAEEAFRGQPLPADEEQVRLKRGEPFAWRLSMAAARAKLGDAFDRLTYIDETGTHMAQPELAGDIILARKDVGVAYHLAVTVDDALQGITHVIRGDDLRDAIHVQRLLQALLDLPTPTYRHHRLIMGADGKRLAKRNGAQSLAELRADGVTVDDIRQRLDL